MAKLSKKKAEELIKGMDWKPVLNTLKKKTGAVLKPSDLTVEYEANRSYAYLTVESKDIKDQMGAMGRMYTKCIFGGKGRRFDNDDTKLWFSLHFYYDHLGGGSNGVSVFDVDYDTKAKTWRIMFNRTLVYEG